MTLLNWEMSEHNLSIFSDTLVLNSEDRRPRSLMTKVFVLPHLNGLITGTGLAPLISDFHMEAKESILARDIIHLDEFASGCLSNLWERYVDQLPSDATTTIYTFGYDKQEQRIRAFAYRSTSNFESEELGYGMALKPAPSNLAAFESIVDFQSFVDRCLQQQSDDRSLPLVQRVGIGGELWLYTLNIEDGRPIFAQQLVQPFDHFDDDWEVMLAQLPANRGIAFSRSVLARDT